MLTTPPSQVVTTEGGSQATQEGREDTGLGRKRCIGNGIERTSGAKIVLPLSGNVDQPCNSGGRTGAWWVICALGSESKADP
jgi:hypothetical protein